MIYSFLFKGKNNNSNFFTTFVDFENIKSFKDACIMANKEAIKILKFKNGGTINIFDINGKFINNIKM